MKLISSRNKGRHVNKGADRNGIDHSANASDKADAIKKLSRKKIIKRLVIAGGVILILTGTCLAVVYTPL